MFLNKLFTIVSQEVNPGSVKCMIALNQHHEIFSGHFPGLPVLPGACMLQIVKEIFQCVERGRYNLISGDNIKFLAVLDPREHSQIHVLLNYEESASGQIIFQASLSDGPLTFLKMKATFRPTA